MISCIEQAILCGKIQPWMHQVLALAMQAAGRPKSQIERVLLSSQDLIANDPRSMVTLAAYLVQFGQLKQATELYRQAASLDPSRPEPFVLGLELAVRTKNPMAVNWSAPEVLSYSWSKGREHLNQLAESAAAEAVETFLKNGDFSRAFELQSAMRKARRLDLILRLEWNGQGDLDLEVIDPQGKSCSVTQPITASGGVFTHDGYGPNQNNCYEEYLCPQGIVGEYQAIVRHVSGNIVGKRARLTIIRDRGSNNEETIGETVFLGQNDQTIRLSLTSGRRPIANAEIRPIVANVETKRASQPSILGQAGNQAASGRIGVANSNVGFVPVVTMVNEGIQMSAMAIVSGDRRYVRISANPAFSSISEIFSYTFSQ